MAQSKADLLDKLDEYLEQYAEDVTEWYVGITENPMQRLYDQHGVSQDYGRKKYLKSYSTDIAREVEQRFLDIGLQGGDGGGDQDAKYVYIYKMTPYTTP